MLFRSGWAQLTETQSKDYFYNGGVSLEVNSRSTYNYHATNFQLKQQDLFYTENGVEQHQQTRLYHPISIPSGYYAPLEYVEVQKLVPLNRINDVVITENFKNGNLLSTQVNQYQEVEPNLVLPSKVQVGKEDETPQDRLIFHKYDSYGNPLEVSKKDGTKISYIWGHSKTKPIAKIENASYTDIIAELSMTEEAVLALDESDMTVINGLRASLPQAMVSTYTYELLVGLISTIDPKGDTTTYEYDEFNRLKFVKDSEGNILSENQYNYKN